MKARLAKSRIHSPLPTPATVFIVGAGFSMHAGLPLQTNFTEKLLEGRDGERHDQKQLISALSKFVNAAFDHNKKADAKFWPELEDIFITIDIAANTGHHLGKHYAPAKLRSIRRMLLSRIMYMLDECYNSRMHYGNDDAIKLDSFFKKLSGDGYAFISMNWDTVIERKLVEHKKAFNFDYRCGAINAVFSPSGDKIKVVNNHKLPGAPVVKMHGSVNWLYCDNCRKLFWFSADRATDIAAQLLTDRENKELGFKDKEKLKYGKWKCPDCTTVTLTTRIATFSYLKALDFPMFQRSWMAAEDILRGAKKWVFIGYSLPAADYEFKYLLKRIQLSRMTPPKFVVITGSRRKPQTRGGTYTNYQRFFGRGIKKNENVFYDGLSEEAINAAI